MSKDTVAIAFVAEALTCLQGTDTRPEALLEECGIDPAQLHQPAARVPATRFSRLWLRIALLLDDEFFGLDPRRLKVGTYAALCHNATLASNLEDALKTSIALLNVILDSLQLHLQITATHDAELSIREAHPGNTRPFAHETLLILIYGLMCWLINKRIPVRQARFGYPQPARWREYEAMFCPELRFDAATTTLCFDARQLREPVVQTHRSASRFLRAAPLNVVVKYRNSRSASVQLRRLLRDCDAARLPSFDEAAAQLNIHPDRLRRDLRREDQTFRALRDARLQEQACSLLEDTSLAMDEVARRLGFSESSAFSRAFRRWTGQSPGQFRSRLQP